MVNGFQMYLDEHDGKLGGATVKFIVEDDKGTVDGDVSMAKKLILQDKVDMLVGAVLGTAAYALAPISTRKRRSSSVQSPRGTTSPSVNPTNFLTLYSPRGSRRSQLMRSGNGLQSRRARL